MKMIIDLSSAQPQGPVKVNGGGEYAFILLKQLIKFGSNKNQIDVVVNAKLGDNQALNQYVNDKNINVYKYIDVDDFSSIIAQNFYDQVILPICYYKYGNLRVDDSVRVISAIHDLCDIYYYGKIKVKYGRYPKLDHLNFLRYLRDLINNKSNYNRCVELHRKAFEINHNQYMYTVSYFSKYSFQYYLGIDDTNSINVYYPPEIHSEVSLTNDSEVLKKYGLNKDRYFMLSACCRWAKNDSIAAFAIDKLFSNPKIKELLAGFKVILLGTDDIYKKYILHNVVNRDKFVFDNFVDDYTIECLYKNAFMFIFPSVLEGFGLPPIEAMKYKTLVACSTAMSIPEVCGDAALYFDPYDIDSISLAILKGFDEELSIELKEKEIKKYEEIQIRRKTDMDSLIKVILNSK